jgi:nitrate reductase NapAB chaperone NapD
MTISSAVVEVKEGAAGTVLKSLGSIEKVSVYGIKDNQIVMVIEDRDMRSIQDTIKKIYGIESVVGVYPVYAGYHDDQETG